MPTYGYHCPHCQTEFEVFQRMTDDAGADCPRCGTAGRRLFFPTGIVFKGSGFYKTDSRRASTASVGGGSVERRQWVRSAESGGGEGGRDHRRATTSLTAAHAAGRGGDPVPEERSVHPGERRPDLRSPVRRRC